MRTLIIFTALYFFSTAGVFSQQVNRSYRSNSGYVERTHYDMKAKIVNGIMNGTITAREARRLLERSESIHFKTERMRSNGKLSRRQYNKLTRELTDLNRMIVREVKDADRIKGLNSNRYVRNGKRSFFK